MPVSDVKRPGRLSLPHWQALLEAGVGDSAQLGLPDSALDYLKACLLHGDSAQWQAYGNGWSLKSGSDWQKRAKEFVPAEGDMTLRDSQVVEAARCLACVEAREQGTPLKLPKARELLSNWAHEYSKFGLLSAGNELLNELVAAQAAWLNAILLRRPWPSLDGLQKLVDVSGAHALWLGRNPLTAVCFPFSGVVQLLGKAGDQLPADVTDAFASSLEQLVLIESSERRRRDQWVAKLRELAARAPGGAS
jgi:hypothetical protein